MATGGVVEQIERDSAQTIEASTQQLGMQTQDLVGEHNRRVAGAEQTAALEYFKDRNGESISTEELAILHYIQSGAEGLPNDEQLASRLAAAEKVFGIIADTDMLLSPANEDAVVKLSGEETRDIKLDSRGMHPVRGNTEGGASAFGGARLRLPALGRVHTFSLIGQEDLATPADTVEAVDGLFRTKAGREAIVADRSGSYVPIIAGSMAVSRFAVNMGVKVPISQQHIETDTDCHPSFLSFARDLAAVDAELGAAVIEEVRERKPKMLQTIQNVLRTDVDSDMKYLLDAEDEYDEKYGATDISAWFERDDVQLFFTKDEIQRLRDRLISDYQAGVKRQMDQRIDSVTKKLAS